MNGRMAKKIRKALGYKKSPSHVSEQGRIVEHDGNGYKCFFRRNNEANRYRWWKKGVTSGLIRTELIDHLAHLPKSHLGTDLRDQKDTEECA